MQTFQFPKSLNINTSERSRYILPSVTVTFGLTIWFLTRTGGKGIIDFLLAHQSAPIILYIAAIAIAVFSIFTIGHILDLSSQFILERLFADKLGGFPHERLVPIRATTARYRLFLKRKRAVFGRSISFYEGTKVAIVATSLLTICHISYRSPKIYSSSSLSLFFGLASAYWATAVAVGLISLIPALLVGYLPGATPKDNFRRVESFLEDTRTKATGSPPLRLLINTIKIMMGMFLRPATYIYDSVDRFVRAAFRLNTELDEDTFSNFTKVFHRRFGISFESIGNNDRFWLPYLAILHSRSEVLKPIVELRSMANFCRNQALALFITSILLSSSYRIGQQSVSEIFTKTDTYNISILLFVLSWVFYWKFLQTYYAFTKMTFRAFATLPLTPAQEPNEAKLKQRKNRPVGLDTSS